MLNNEITFNIQENVSIGFVVDEEGYNARFSIEDVQYVPGPQGPYFLPNVSEEGIISWTNNGGLPNPEPRLIMGPKGDKGDDGQVYIHIVENPQMGDTVTISTTK